MLKLDLFEYYYSSPFCKHAASATRQGQGSGVVLEPTRVSRLSQDLYESFYAGMRLSTNHTIGSSERGLPRTHTIGSPAYT